MLWSTLVFAGLSVTTQARKQIPHPTEVQPRLSYERCNLAEGCKRLEGNITIDVNWRRVISNQNPDRLCYRNDTWDNKICKTPTRCQENCVVEGVSDYDASFGVKAFGADGEGVSLRLVTKKPSSDNPHHNTTVVGSRLYHVDHNGRYVLWKLKGLEFAFDVDVSKLPCALNGALYFSEMSHEGGTTDLMSTGRPSSFFGGGYCDAQCPQEQMFLDGKVNTNKRTGLCCQEMDILEAGSRSQSYTAHPCHTTGPVVCQDKQCRSGAEGYCAQAGCGFASYQLGDPNFYGPGKLVDTNFPFTVVTQFMTDNGEQNGTLNEIRRLYVQNGTVINNSWGAIPQLDVFDSITEGFCNLSAKVFGGQDTFKQKGGLKAMGESLDRGMVLVMSLWDDHTDTNMKWLDGNFPLNASPSIPGISRGPCTTQDGTASTVEASHPDASVRFSNLRFGEIDSTYVPASCLGAGSDPW